MFEIMFNDLKPEAQKRFLEYMGLKDASEGNYEVVPITMIDYNDKDEDEDKNETVTSREVDCPCDCSDCEHADKCTENGRYDFEEDDNIYKGLKLTVAPGDIEVSEDDKDHAILLHNCFLGVPSYRWYSAKKVYLSFVGDMDEVLGRPYAMIECWDVEERYDNGNLGIHRHKPI